MPESSPPGPTASGRSQRYRASAWMPLDSDDCFDPLRPASQSARVDPKRKQEFSVTASENGHSTLNLTGMFAANRCGLHVAVPPLAR